MEYTDQQRAAFRDAYAKRFRKQLIMIVLLFAVMAPLPFVEDSATFFGLSGAVLGPISLVAIVTRVGDLQRPKLALPRLRQLPRLRHSKEPRCLRLFQAAFFEHFFDLDHESARTKRC